MATDNAREAELVQRLLNDLDEDVPHSITIELKKDTDGNPDIRIVPEGISDDPADVTAWLHFITTKMTEALSQAAATTN